MADIELVVEDGRIVLEIGTGGEIAAAAAAASAAAAAGYLEQIPAAVSAAFETAAAPGGEFYIAVDEATDAIAAAQNAAMIRFETWALLAAMSTAGLISGQGAKVHGVDAGTHTDPVVGGTVNNVGVYRWSSSPAGWKRIANLEADDAAASASAAATSAAILSAFTGGAPEIPLVLASSAIVEKYTEGAGSVSPSAYRSRDFVSGTSYTIEWIARADERKFLNFYCGAGALFDTTFDLSDGSIPRLSSGNSATITPLGNDWYRGTVTRVATATTTNNLQVRMGTASNTFTYSGDGASGMFVPWVSLKVTGTLTELLTSTILSNAYWSKQNSSFVSEVLAGSAVQAEIEALQLSIASGEPAKLTEASGAALSPAIYRSRARTSGMTYRAWVIAKAGERTRLNIYNAGGAAYDATFDLSSGVASGTGATITKRGEDEYLCEVEAVAGATSSTTLQIRIFPASGGHPYTGDGASGLYILAAGEDENGVNVLASDAAALVASGWTKQNVTVALAPSALFSSVGERIESLEGERATLAALALAVNDASGAKFTEAAGAGKSPSVYNVFTITSGRTYRAWAIAKAGERTRLNLYAANSGVVFDATFDLDAGTASGTGAAISRRGDGDYLCEAIGVAPATGGGNLQFRVYPASGGQPYTGDGASGLYVLSAGLDEDGVAISSVDAATLASSAWLKQHVTVALAPAVLFSGLDARTTALERSAETGGSLVGIKCACIGTSITDAGLYTSALALVTGMVVTELGTSGGSLASGSHYGSLYIYNAIATIPVDSELVIVEAGINDFGTDNSTLGALGDTSTSTFYGAIYAAVADIIARAPSAKIVFLTPYSGGILPAGGTATHRIGVTNGKGYTLPQFQRAVEEGAEYCGWPAIDVGRESGIGYFNSGTYTSDGLHINATGAARFAAFLRGELLRMADAGFFDA